MDIRGAVDLATSKEIHANSDVDSVPEAQHHTLGAGPNQASPGTAWRYMHSNLSLFYVNSGIWYATSSNIGPNDGLQFGMPYDGRMFFHCTSSGYSGNGGAFAFYWYVDGVYMDQEYMYLNQANVHTTFNPIVFFVDLKKGFHRIVAKLSNSLVVNSDDRCTVFGLPVPTPIMTSA